MRASTRNRCGQTIPTPTPFGPRDPAARRPSGMLREGETALRSPCLRQLSKDVMTGRGRGVLFEGMGWTSHLLAAR